MLNPSVENSDEDDDDDDGERLSTKPKMSVARSNADGLLEYLEHPTSSQIMKSYAPLVRELRDALIKEQSIWPMKQTKIRSFFTSTTPSPRPSSRLNSPMPGSSTSLSSSSRDVDSPDEVTLPHHGSSHSTPTPEPIPVRIFFFILKMPGDIFFILDNKIVFCQLYHSQKYV